MDKKDKPTPNPKPDHLKRQGPQIAPYSGERATSAILEHSRPPLPPRTMLREAPNGKEDILCTVKPVYYSGHCIRESLPYSNHFIKSWFYCSLNIST